MRLHIVPCTIEQANGFVARFHRHHGPVVSARIALACADEQGRIRGVALAGRPVARFLDDGLTIEVNRVATDGAHNACSILYGAVWRAARAIGYQRCITYTLAEECGASLRATGWKLTAITNGHSWNTPGRSRKEQAVHLIDKSRWEVTAGTALPFDDVTWPESDETPQPTLFSEVLP